jgi:hypothetical protein
MTAAARVLPPAYELKESFLPKHISNRLGRHEEGPWRAQPLAILLGCNYGEARYLSANERLIDVAVPGEVRGAPNRGRLKSPSVP